MLTPCDQRFLFNDSINILRANARKEYEDARIEADPEIINKVGHRSPVISHTACLSATYKRMTTFHARTRIMPTAAYHHGKGRRPAGRRILLEEAERNHRGRGFATGKRRFIARQRDGCQTHYREGIRG